MSVVSQIDYWKKKGNKPVNTGAGTDIKEEGTGGAYLSYDVFMALSVVGGLLALDHLYLRSPLTFLAKIVVNILFLGTWWLYDASQAIFNKDTVKVFGLGIPGFGPKGIGAGVMASDVPDKKHMSFFLYALSLMLGGIFGLDSFIVGDKQSGFIRLVCLITVILAPVAIFWWLFNLFKFFFKTQDVTNLYWEYFGAPPPAEYGMSWGEKLATRFPFLQKFFGPITRIKESLIETAKTAKQDVTNYTEAVLEFPLNTVKGTIDEVTDTLKPIVKPVVNTLVEPIKNTIDKGLDTAQEGFELGRNIVSRGSNLASQTLNVIGKTADNATEALSIVPEATKLAQGFTPMAAAAALTKLKQDGGMINQTSMLPYMLIGTLAVIVVSGLVLSYRRSRQNEQPRKDDSPPQPGVFGVSNKEKST
jgi:hypothetical protein